MTDEYLLITVDAGVSLPEFDKITRIVAWRIASIGSIYIA